MYQIFAVVEWICILVSNMLVRDYMWENIVSFFNVSKNIQNTLVFRILLLFF